jgi:hypothetical protein
MANGSSLLSTTAVDWSSTATAARCVLLLLTCHWHHVLCYHVILSSSDDAVLYSAQFKVHTHTMR